MSIAKYTYWYFQKQLDKEVCEKILSIGKNKLKNYCEKGKEKNGKVGRKSDICWLNINEERWIYDLVLPVITTANTNAGWKYEFDYIEPIQFTKYGVKQYYNWHCDQIGCHNSVNKTDNLNLNNKVRKLSVSINLSDPNEYDGGDLMLKQNGSNKNLTINEIKPQGSIAVFPSYVWHKVTPVTKGTRYSLVLWTSGQPFK